MQKNLNIPVTVYFSSHITKKQGLVPRIDFLSTACINITTNIRNQMKLITTGISTRVLRQDQVICLSRDKT